MPRAWQERKLRLPAKAKSFKLRPGEVYFFAQLLTANVACPRCDEVTRVGFKTRNKVAHISVWNQRSQRFCCPGCGLVLVLGIVGYRILQRSRLNMQPPDTIASWKQALELRRNLSILTEEVKRTGDAVNQIREIEDADD